MRSKLIVVVIAGLLGTTILPVGCSDDGDSGPGACGNGQIDPGEQCDDGNLLEHDGCDASCQLETFCGDGLVEFGEECDDGNFEPGDGCTPGCETEVGCGNGRLEVGEQCDDDNLLDGDGCDALCLDEEAGAVCGNAILELGEGCDDGNSDDGDGCDAACLREDGCGDGVVVGVEGCDDGNTVSGDGCGDDCQVEYICGDNTCEEANFETCEACPADCCPACGNGQLDAGEGCDDGNNDDGDGCSRGCADEVPGAVCGNGLWEAGEACDDGNTTIHDGCSDLCELEYECGDQVCDTDMGESCAVCQPDCCPYCGNGVREVGEGEACDGGDLGGLSCEDFCYDGGTLACGVDCTHDLSQCTGTGPQCGDGYAECSEQCDGADLKGRTCQTLGYTTGTLSCVGSCSYDVSQCTGLVWYFHDDFEDQAGTQAKWTLAGDWEWGAPSGYVSLDGGVEPSAAFDGAYCLGTTMGGDYTDSSAFLTNRAVTIPIDLSAATQPALTFKMWVSAEATYDGANVWISDDGGVTFNPLSAPSVAFNDSVGGRDCWSGTNLSVWQLVQFDLSSFVGQTIQLAFALESDGSVTYPGMYVDDVLITEPGLVPVDITTGPDLGIAATDSPFTQSLAAAGGTGSYDWSIQPGGVNDAWLSIDPATGVLSGTPVTSQVGPVSVVVRAAASGSPSNFDEITFTLDVVQGVWAETFETGAASGWTLTGDWAWGTPPGYLSLIFGLEPTGCFAGTGCLGTGIGVDYSNDRTYTGNRAVSPPIDLTGATSPQLQLKMWISVEDGYDGVNVWVCTNGGASCAVLPNPSIPYDGTIASQDAWYGQVLESWNDVTFDLSAYAGQIIQLQFALYSDSSETYPGMYVDELRILD